MAERYLLQLYPKMYQVQTYVATIPVRSCSLIVDISWVFLQNVVRHCCWREDMHPLVSVFTYLHHIIQHLLSVPGSSNVDFYLIKKKTCESTKAMYSML